METIKVVINTCHGGFGLSEDALERYIKETNGEAGVYEHEIPRDHPVLVRIEEEMGDAAGCSFSDLKVVEIPADVNWYIDEYNGWEWVAERHRTWR